MFHVIKNLLKGKRRDSSFIRKIRKLKKQGLDVKGFISSSEAAELGYSDAYLGWRGIGDQILLRTAAEIYFHKTRRRLLLIVDRPEFFVESEGAFYVLNDIEPDQIFAEVQRSDEFIENHKYTSISGKIFDLHFLDCMRWRKVGQAFMAEFPSNSMLEEMLKNLGLQGKFKFSAHLPLTKNELSLFAPPKEKQRVCVMTGGNVPYKVLPPEVMQEVVDKLNKYQNIELCQVGSATDPALSGVNRYNGVLSLRETAALLSNSTLFVGTIGGLMHLANAVGISSVIAYSAEPISYGGYGRNINLLARPHCELCAKNFLNPLFQVCPLKRQYACINSFTSDQLYAAILRLLNDASVMSDNCFEIVDDFKKGDADYLRPLLFWKYSLPAVKS